MDIWFVVTAVSFIVSLFATFSVSLAHARLKVILFWFALTFSSWILFSIQEYMIRNLVSDSLTEQSFVIGLEKDIDESRLLNALKNKEYINIYRTQPMVKHKVRIVVNLGEVELLLAKDSVNQNVYWVYYPKYLFSSMNDIGKIQLD